MTYILPDPSDISSEECVWHMLPGKMLIAVTHVHRCTVMYTVSAHLLSRWVAVPPQQNFSHSSSPLHGLLWNIYTKTQCVCHEYKMHDVDVKDEYTGNIVIFS